MVTACGGLDDGDAADFLQACREWYQSSRTRAKLTGLEAELTHAREKAAAEINEHRHTNLSLLNRHTELLAANTGLRQQLQEQADVSAVTEQESVRMKQQLLELQLELQAKSATAETNRELVCKLRRKNKELEGVIQKYQRFHGAAMLPKLSTRSVGCYVDMPSSAVEEPATANVSPGDRVPEGGLRSNGAAATTPPPGSSGSPPRTAHRTRSTPSAAIRLKQDEVQVKTEATSATAACHLRTELTYPEDRSAEGRQCVAFGVERCLEGGNGSLHGSRGRGSGKADATTHNPMEHASPSRLVVEDDRSPQPTARASLAREALFSLAATAVAGRDADLTVWDTERRPEDAVSVTQRSEATSSFRRPDEKPQSGRLGRSSKGTRHTKKRADRDRVASLGKLQGHQRRDPSKGQGATTPLPEDANAESNAPELTRAESPKRSQGQPHPRAVHLHGAAESVALAEQRHEQEGGKESPSTPVGLLAEGPDKKCSGVTGKSPKWRTKGGARRQKGSSFDSDLPGKHNGLQQGGGGLQALWSRHQQQQQQQKDSSPISDDEGTKQSPGRRSAQTAEITGNRKRKASDNSAPEATARGATAAHRPSGDAALERRQTERRAQPVPKGGTRTGSTWVMGYGKDGTVNWATAGGGPVGQATDSLMEDDGLTQPPPGPAQGRLEASRPNQPTFKYREVVRKKADRAALRGWDCADCRKFYENAERTGDAALLLAMPECSHKPQGPQGQGNTVQRIMNEYSKHRHQHKPPETPPGFWDMGFMDSLDSRAAHPT